MTKQEHFHAIVEHKSTQSGFWHGSPHPDSTPALYAHFGVQDDFELGLALGSILRWIHPEHLGMWPQEAGPMFDFLNGEERTSLSQPGVFAGCEEPSEVEAYHWPSAQSCDFSRTIAEIERTRQAGQAVCSGAWCSFFHDVCDFFGMEEYFIKMHTAPDVVEAVTERVVAFYLEANERLFTQAKGSIDAFFFGNDLGSQLDLLVSPACFARFILPSIVRFIQQAHRHGYKVILHSCGSIARIIPQLIEAGVDVLHPIQARAADMDAATLAGLYRDTLVFMGGVDTQHLLPNGSPAQVSAEVARLKTLFGPNFIVSPSHEALLPNVPAENLAAMAQEALR